MRTELCNSVCSFYDQFTNGMSKLLHGAQKWQVTGLCFRVAQARGHTSSVPVQSEMENAH
jgi:aspartate-semialdehyde dehydrogenase